MQRDTTAITIRIPTKVRKALEARAKAEDRTISSLVRFLINQILDAK